MTITKRSTVRAKRTPKKPAPQTRRSNFAHSKKVQNRRWLVGFTCYTNRYGCECNLDTQQRVKNEFKRNYGFDYDDYCYYDLVEAPDAKTAKEWAWDAQGATESPHDVWEDVEVIGLAGTPTRSAPRR